VAVGEVVEVFAVAAGSIEAAVVLVRSADRAAAAQFGDRWVAAWREDRLAELQYAGRWAVVLLSVPPEAPRYADQWGAPPP
jgi:hypothetical protein